MREPARARRDRTVVVTGLGAVSAWGWGVPPLWRGLLSGETGIRSCTRFDVRGHRTRLAGEVPDAPHPVAQAFPEWRRLSQADRFALAASAEALAQSGLTSLDGRSAGVFFASSTGGMLECETWFSDLVGGRRARPSALGVQQLNAPGDAVARHFGAEGPVETVSSACASGGLAIAAALDAIVTGEVELAVAGGSDSLCQVTYAGFNSLRSVDEAPCRPFRASRQGLSLGEGAAVLILERPESARERGAEILAELSGSGASCDAHHMTAPHPQGTGAAAALRRALAEAGTDAAAVDFLNAHGTGTPLNDAAEWGALVEVFGDRAGSLPVEATKASVGHLLGSAGAIEAVATVMSLRHGLLHPAPLDGALDPSTPVDLVQGGPRAVASRRALSVNLAFGGANAALCFSRWATG